MSWKNRRYQLGEVSCLFSYLACLHATNISLLVCHTKICQFLLFDKIDRLSSALVLHVFELALLSAGLAGLGSHGCMEHENCYSTVQITLLLSIAN